MSDRDHSCDRAHRPLYKLGLQPPSYNSTDRYHRMLCCSAVTIVNCWCQQLLLIPWYRVCRAEGRG